MAYRWNTHRIRSLCAADIHVYHDEFDGLLDTQVVWEPYLVEHLGILSHLCVEMSKIWLARVPLISWQCVEWNFPERVLRQFGLYPRTDILPMEPGYVRVDGRGKSSIDWFAYHHCYITMWEQRLDSLVQPDLEDADRAWAVRRYMRWYRAWASLYLLKASHEGPTTFGARSASDRQWRRFFGRVEAYLQPVFGTTMTYGMPVEDVAGLEGLCSNIRKNVYISDADVYADASGTEEEKTQ